MLEVNETAAAEQHFDRFLLKWNVKGRLHNKLQSYPKPWPPGTVVSLADRRGAAICFQIISQLCRTSTRPRVQPLQLNRVNLQVTIPVTDLLCCIHLDRTTWLG